MSNDESIKVLIVDDIAVTRENIRKLLQFEVDFEIVGAARNGQEGIELAKELQPDVILMDINMPVWLSSLLGAFFACFLVRCLEYLAAFVLL